MSAAVECPDCAGEPIATNQAQLQVITYASSAFEMHFRDCPDVHVRGDMILYYEEGSPDVKVVPEVFVARCITEAPRSSYRLWEVAVVPQFAMEVASKSTFRRDRDEKCPLYERLGVQERWRFDPEGECCKRQT